MKRLLSVLMTAVFLLAFGTSLPTAAAPDAEVKYQSKQITAHLYSMDETAAMTCLFRDDLPSVPYIGAVDYLNQLYLVPYTCAENADGTYTVSDAYGEMIIDVDKDTIHFDDYENFVNSDVREITEDETAYYLSDESEYETIGEVNGLDLDLGAYGIDLTALDGMVYFPLSVINNLYGGTYHAALYLGGELYFADVMEDEAYYSTEELFESVSRDKTLIEYSYQTLCFVMDHLYGCPPKAKLSELIREKGFDQAIEEYNATTASAKELLLSDNLVDYCFGLLYLDMYLDDGGHTMLSYGLQMGLELYADSEFVSALYESMYDYANGRLLTIQQFIMDEAHLAQTRNELSEKREQQLAPLTEVKSWDEAVFYQSGNLGIFSFDEFTDAVVEPFKWSLDYAAEHGFEDFVLDLSLNGGGSTAVAIYMLSVMCGSSRSDYYNTITGNRYSLTTEVDKNLDGSFDEKDDEVIYDLRFGVMTTQFTFSAANLLACLLQYYGVAVLGEDSGGGTCAVALLYDPAGYGYVISEGTTMVDPDGNDLDLGAKRDYALPGYAWSYAGYYDAAMIAKGLDEFYTNHPVSRRPTKPVQATADESETVAVIDYSRYVPVMWAVSGVFALGCVIAFAVILISGARKKRGWNS